MASTFVPLQREEVERIARDGYRAAFPPPAGPPPPPRNVHSALFVLDGERIEVPYRGRMWELLPVSFSDGLRLVAAKAAIEAFDENADAGDIIRYHAALELTVRLARRYLRPRGRLRRLRWRLRLSRNPFRHATEAEVGQFLGFFLASRMMSSVRSRPAHAAVSAPTSSRRRSSTGSRSGPGRGHGANTAPASRTSAELQPRRSSDSLKP